MNPYILTLFNRQPRRIRVIENILKNRRSEANLFWGYNYQILGALGAERQLKRQDYDQQLAQWVKDGLLKIDNQQASLTEAGLEQVKIFWDHHYQPHFIQWAWVTNYQTFANRVLLALQVISQYQHQDHQYLPLSLSEYEMNRVRQWVRSLKPKDIRLIINCLQKITEELASVDERLAILLTYRLIGYQTSGWTNQQAAQHLAVTIDEIPVMWRDLWLKMAATIASQSGPLTALTQDLISLSPASQSAMKTIQTFQSGISIAEVSQRRHLKISTVREHILEIAILRPELISISALIPTSNLAKLKATYQGSAFNWQFQEDSDEASAFFEFRLYQIMRCHRENGDYPSTT